MKPSPAEAQKAIRTLITYIGDDPARDGLVDTPARVLKAWTETWGAGYQDKTQAELLRLFPTNPRHGDFNQMVVVRDIAVYSHCEHHMTPFFGRAHIAYVPRQKGLVGLSKLARVVDYFGRRLQVQERLTEQVAAFLCEHLSPDIGVMLSCSHMCMISRGVHQPNSLTRTTALRGAFYNEPATRAEFIQACL